MAIVTSFRKGLFRPLTRPLSASNTAHYTNGRFGEAASQRQITH